MSLSSSECLVQRLLERGVVIPAPQAVVIDDVPPENISATATLLPGTCLSGQSTRVGAGSVIGQGGGAYIRNAQLGANVTFMQGVAHDCTLLDRVSVRHGSEIREGCLLEEGADLGHTVGLKQTILLSDVVIGSLVNFCDAIVT
jgi:UDP-N-acetylglucosamine/UDP-N-acetylgalactosamine diphosphorylase